jgi:hypothetical protein
VSTDAAFTAFRQVQFHSVFDLQQVWTNRPSGHLPLQERALQRFRATLEKAQDLQLFNPLGLCFVGPAGAGKTHLLGEIRREAAEQNASFILSDLTDVRDFWPLLALHYLQSLQKRINGVRQLDRLLEFLLSQADDEPVTSSVLPEIRTLHREGISAFANEVLQFLRPIYSEEIQRRHRVFRALLYLESYDFELSERAYSFLQGVEQCDEESQKILLAGTNSPKSVTVDLAWFLSLLGPTVLAFDQLDPFVAQNNLASTAANESLQVLFGVTKGVFSIHEEFPRTLIVITCLESSWKVLQSRAIASFQDRFEEIETLSLIRDPATPVELIGLRQDESYRCSNFVPPYRTWPFTRSFFVSLPPGLTPREVLNRAEKHRLDCARAGSVVELHTYCETAQPCSDIDLSHLDDRFESELARVDVWKLLNEEHEDELGSVLAEASRLFCRELPSHPDVDLAVDEQFRESRQYRSLHLRLRRIFRLEGDREEHVCVRVLQKSHSRSFQVRLSAALTTSGMSDRLEGRHLFLLRNDPPPAGGKTAEIIKAATANGAEFVPIYEGDVATAAAVVALAKSGDPLFETWLLQTLLLSKTALFRQLAPTWSNGNHRVPMNHQPVKPPPAPAPIIVKPILIKQVVVGSSVERESQGKPVLIPLEDLTRNVMLRAGTDSGSAGLVRNLVQQAARCGVSSIVIDTVKDLTTLRAHWNTREIFTPGQSGGEPLRLDPLPNLNGTFEAQERDAVIELVVAGILPLALQKKSAMVERAILRRIMEWLTDQPEQSGHHLPCLLHALRNMPGECFQGYHNERKRAASIADGLESGLADDPLYHGPGSVFDPENLLCLGHQQPRISVLSLFGLPDFMIRAHVVAQLSSTLLNWARTHCPKPTLRGLLVLQDSAPFLSRLHPESKPGLMLLANCASKYGLGLILATENPKDLDPETAGGFATQIFGSGMSPQVLKPLQQASGLNLAELQSQQFFLSAPSLLQPARLRS